MLSAFLLFQVQPLIAKLILPWFGGSAAVWTSCMLFFQMALLAGYAYAHWITRQSGARQTFFHLGLLALSFLSLPISPSAWWKPQGAEEPLLRILGLLAATVGLPYFLLSATSPLLQAWYSRSNGGAFAVPVLRTVKRGIDAGSADLPRSGRALPHESPAGLDVVEHLYACLSWLARQWPGDPGTRAPK